MRARPTTRRDFQFGGLPVRCVDTKLLNHYNHAVNLDEANLIDNVFTIGSFVSDGSMNKALEEIGQLRVAAWQNDGEMPMAASNCGSIWLDEHDFHAHHWTIKIGEILIASARLCFHVTENNIPDKQYIGAHIINISFPAAFFNRLVIHPSARGNGFTRKLDNLRMELAESRNAASAVANTWSPVRIRQLLSSGWVLLGESPERFIKRSPNFVLTKNLQP